jgi:vancomycin aglycone glucosyltransferase
MRVLLSRYESRRDVEPTMGLVAQRGPLGAEARVSAPPDFAELLAGVSVPPAPIGQPVRLRVTGGTPPLAADLPPRAAALVAAQLDTTAAAAAEECEAPGATGVMPTGGWR